MIVKITVGKATLGVHNEKFGRNGGGKGKNRKPPMNGMMVHVERDEEKYKDVKHSNKFIDKDRTHLNKVLYRGEGSFIDRFERVIEEKYTGTQAIRHDAVTMIQTTVNFGGTVQNASMEEQNEMLTNFYEHFRENHPDIISAVIHNDETNPHLHICWVPMTRDGRLCASQVNGKSALSHLQRESLEFMQREYPQHGFYRLTDEDKLFNGLSPEAKAALDDMKKELERGYEMVNQMLEEIEQREQAVTEQENELAGLVEQLQTAKQTYETKLKDMDEWQTSLEERENALKESESSLDDREAKIAEAEAELNEKYEELNKKTDDLMVWQQNTVNKLKGHQKQLNEREERVKSREQRLDKREQQLNEREQDVEYKYMSLEEYQRRVKDVFDSLEDKWKNTTNVGMRNKLKRHVERFLPIEDEVNSESIENLENLEHILNTSDFDDLTSDNMSL